MSNAAAATVSAITRPTIEDIIEQLRANAAATGGLQDTTRSHRERTGTLTDEVEAARLATHEARQTYAVTPTDSNRAALDSARTSENKIYLQLVAHRDNVPPDTAQDRALLDGQRSKLKRQLHRLRLDVLRAEYPALLVELQELLPRVIATNYHMNGTPPGSVDISHFIRRFTFADGSALLPLIDKTWGEIKHNLEAEE